MFGIIQDIDSKWGRLKRPKLGFLKSILVMGLGSTVRRLSENDECLAILSVELCVDEVDDDEGKI